MPTGDAYSSGHLVPSLWDLHMFYLLRLILFRTCHYFSPDHALRISLGTFSILLLTLVSDFGTIKMKNSYSASVGYRASDKVAVIIPYRNRHQHLTLLLHCLTRHMQKQQLEFHIFVAEQVSLIRTIVSIAFRYRYKHLNL